MNYGNYQRNWGLGIFFAGAMFGAFTFWYLSSLRGHRFGDYALKTEEGKVRVENILKIDGEPRYKLNLKGKNIESIVEIKGFNVERGRDGFEARIYGDEFSLVSGERTERYSKGN